MVHIELVYASEEEEFFYEENDIPVSEGQLVGVDVYLGDRVDLVLLDDIYWKGWSCNDETKKE
jgi:hypothetical protein